MAVVVTAVAGDVNDGRRREAQTFETLILFHHHQLSKHGDRKAPGTVSFLSLDVVKHAVRVELHYRDHPAV
jgi:hypothetical protein